jgi:beta-lactamase regulating signal transducer with metallopeptidase domain
MYVTEKLSGKNIWSYYINTNENLNGMNRLYVGSKGDYGMMNIYALGYIDNIRLTIPASVTPTPTEITQGTTVTTYPAKIPTTKQTVTVPTAYPTNTQKSPSAGILAIGAIGTVAVMYGVLTRMKRN